MTRQDNWLEVWSDKAKDADILLVFFVPEVKKVSSSFSIKTTLDKRLPTLRTPTVQIEFFGRALSRIRRDSKDPRGKKDAGLRV